MKKIFLSLFIGFVGLISFSNAGEITTSVQTFDGNTTKNYSSGYCVRFQSASNFRITENGNTITLNNNNSMYCFTSNGSVSNVTSNGYNFYEYNLTDYILNFAGSDYTSEQCQQEYSLMPIDSCNSEYCEMNNLCEVIGGSGSSTLYINDVWHESAPFIYVNIPEEIKRDYLTGEQEFTINVEGLNGDQDYINGIIDVNSYRPTSEDFTQTFVGGLTLIFPYIIITAVILFIRRFIRKIFK